MQRTTQFSLLVLFFSLSLLALPWELHGQAPDTTTTETESIELQGTFSGKSGHTARGTVTLRATEDGYLLILESDFRFDGAPDPKLALGNNGYDKTTLFSELEANRGSQTYTLPASIDPNDFNEVWIWCERYNVPLAVATLERL